MKFIQDLRGKIHDYDGTYLRTLKHRQLTHEALLINEILDKLQKLYLRTCKYFSTGLELSGSAHNGTGNYQRELTFGIRLEFREKMNQKENRN